MLFALFASSLSCGEFVLRRVCSAASLFCGEFVLRRVFAASLFAASFPRRVVLLQTSKPSEEDAQPHDEDEQTKVTMYVVTLI